MCTEIVDWYGNVNMVLIYRHCMGKKVADFIEIFLEISIYRPAEDSFKAKCKCPIFRFRKRLLKTKIY